VENIEDYHSQRRERMMEGRIVATRDMVFREGAELQRSPRHIHMYTSRCCSSRKTFPHLSWPSLGPLARQSLSVARSKFSIVFLSFPSSTFEHHPEEHGSSEIGLECASVRAPGTLDSGVMNGSRQSPFSPRERQT